MATANLGMNPSQDVDIGPVNLGVQKDILDFQVLSFRDDNPADLYDQDSIDGWQAHVGEYIEVWDEGDGNPYLELQAHFGSHGVKQEFNLLPDSQLTLILRYKGRYSYYHPYDNAFRLEVEGATSLTVDGNVVPPSGGVSERLFMDDDDWEKYEDWHYASVVIQADPDAITLVPITLSLVPVNTGISSQEEITRGGFVGLMPFELSLHHPDIDLTVPWKEYLPGYSGEDPVLCTPGKTFETLDYNGPQEVHIRLNGPAIELADSASLEITEVTSYPGWAVNAGDSEDEDFSFSGVGNTRTTTAEVVDGMLSVPIHCKDYAAWAEIEIILRKDDEAIHQQPITVTLPQDLNGDRIAYKWQRQEVEKWNSQFRQNTGEPHWIDPDDQETWSAIFGEMGGADAELADSDGPGPMPPMADDGDDLTALEEYRGFFLDGGPGITSPQHRRLSVARKELLVEVREMTGTPFAQNYSLSEIMGAVSDFFGNDGPVVGNPGYFKGAILDTYWVRNALNDTETYVTYTDGTTRLAYKYTGTYIDQRTSSNWMGTLCVGWDHKLRGDDRDESDRIYGLTQAGLGILAHEGNRDLRCGHFVKLVMRGKKGEVLGNGAMRAPTGGTALEVDERWDTRYNYQGAAIWVNSIAEGNYPPLAVSFPDELAFAVAHELGHMIIDAVDDGEHWPEGINNLMNVPVGLSNTLLIKDEIEHISLCKRASVKP